MCDTDAKRNIIQGEEIATGFLVGNCNPDAACLFLDRKGFDVFVGRRRQCSSCTKAKPSTMTGTDDLAALNAALTNRIAIMTA